MRRVSGKMPLMPQMIWMTWFGPSYLWQFLTAAPAKHRLLLTLDEGISLPPDFLNGIAPLGSLSKPCSHHSWVVPPGLPSWPQRGGSSQLLPLKPWAQVACDFSWPPRSDAGCPPRPPPWPRTKDLSIFWRWFSYWVYDLQIFFSHSVSFVF